jgi:hypothetical protein
LAQTSQAGFGVPHFPNGWRLNHDREKKNTQIQPGAEQPSWIDAKFCATKIRGFVVSDLESSVMVIMCQNMSKLQGFAFRTEHEFV